MLEYRRIKQKLRAETKRKFKNLQVIFKKTKLKKKLNDHSDFFKIIFNFYKKNKKTTNKFIINGGDCKNKSYKIDFILNLYFSCFLLGRGISNRLIKLIDRVKCQLYASICSHINEYFEQNKKKIIYFIINII